MSAYWAILGLIVLIIGHLVWAFIIYGIITDSDALKDLEPFLPMLNATYMYILAGLAVLADIWIFVSQKKERNRALKR